MAATVGDHERLRVQTAPVGRPDYPYPRRDGAAGGGRWRRDVRSPRGHARERERGCHVLVCRLLGCGSDDGPAPSGRECSRTGTSRFQAPRGWPPDDRHVGARRRAPCTGSTRSHRTRLVRGCHRSCGPRRHLPPYRRQAGRRRVHDGQADLRFHSVGSPSRRNRHRENGFSGCSSTTSISM